MVAINWRDAILLEQDVQRVITQQEINGVHFNSTRARFYVHVLEEMAQRHYHEVLPYLKTKVIAVGTEVSKPFNRTGGVSSRAKKYIGEEEIIGGPFQAVAFELPRISQRDKLGEALLKLGWKPTEFTPGGNPKLTDGGKPVESLEKVAGIGNNLSMWYKTKHRQSQIRGLLSKVRDDGRIPAGANTIGTNTCRMRHSVVVNIPKASEKVFFGKELRSLFTCRYKEGWRLLGGDAKGLEARMEAHYTYPFDGGEYARELLEGDVHSKNADAFGCDRNTAKGGKYAITYGAGIPKFSETLGVSVKEGTSMYKAFWKANPTLAKFTSKCKKASLRGYLVGLDGRKIWMRKFTGPKKDAIIDGITYPNPGNIAYTKAVNTLFQSAGAIVMKRAICYIDSVLKREGLDEQVLKVIDQHDESQYEFLYSDKLYEFLRELYVESIVKAGQYYNLNIPLDGDVKMGISWNQTH